MRVLESFCQLIVGLDVQDRVCLISIPFVSKALGKLPQYCTSPRKELTFAVLCEGLVF